MLLSAHEKSLSDFQGEIEEYIELITSGLAVYKKNKNTTESLQKLMKHKEKSLFLFLSYMQIFVLAKLPPGCCRLPEHTEASSYITSHAD